MQRQTWQPSQYNENASFVSRLGSPVVDLLQPRPGERILDVGCGDGTLASKIESVGAKVIGVDSSREMVAAAQARGIEARVMSGDALMFCSEFDAVFTNAALHWMQDYEFFRIIPILEPSQTRGSFRRRSSTEKRLRRGDSQ